MAGSPEDGVRLQKSIIRCAGVGVAMGNAGPEVKAAADYVTSPVDDDGIRNALAAYGVI